MTIKQWYDATKSARERAATFIRAGVFIEDPSDTALVKKYFTTVMSNEAEWDRRMIGGCQSCNKMARMYREIKIHIEHEYNNIQA
jgi:hypothetical protein